MNHKPTTLARESKTALFLFAHNDDEFFVLPWLDKEVSDGNRVICLYTTDGAAYGEDPTRRLNESRKALCPRGVKTEDIIDLGAKLCVRDGNSFKSILPLYNGIRDAAATWSINRIYTPAWEGGHADHDTTHLLAIALSKITAASVYEFSLYHSYRTPRPFFRCMSLLPASGEISVEKVSFLTALSWLASCRHYPSQIKAFVGLLPLCLLRILALRSLPIRRVGEGNYLTRPYEGPLFYETQFNVPYKDFFAATQGFISDFLGQRSDSSREASTD